jgi:mannose-6-phosphate isomerase-like protein (cupin superfamily)
MKNFKCSRVYDFEAKAFSSLSIRFIDFLQGWPVSVAHETIPRNEKALPFVVHERTGEFVYVLGGGGRAEVGGRSFPVRAGDCLLVPPGVRHRFITGRSSLRALSVFSRPMTFANLDAVACPAPERKRKKHL